MQQRLTDWTSLVFLTPIGYGKTRNNLVSPWNLCLANIRRCTDDACLNSLVLVQTRRWVVAQPLPVYVLATTLSRIRRLSVINMTLRYLSSKPLFSSYQWKNQFQDVHMYIFIAYLIPNVNNEAEEAPERNLLMHNEEILRSGVLFLFQKKN